jgi:leader peptidase (prepilin peptidase)/N-methyltransferase
MEMLLIYAVVGLLVGGLLNVLADTLPEKGNLRTPYCRYCGTAYAPTAWLATVGYLFGRGHCSNCGAPLPLRRLGVELVTAVVFGFVYSRHGFTGHMLVLSLYMAILILVTVIDLEHRLVLNRVILPSILLALIAAPFTPDLNWRSALVGGLLAFGLFYLAALLYPGGMGAGDVKLAAFIGLITGFPNVFVALLVTVLAGGIISLLLVLTKIRSRRDYIPYGPFLVLGGVFALFWGQPIMDDYLDRDQEPAAAAVPGSHPAFGQIAASAGQANATPRSATRRRLGAVCQGEALDRLTTNTIVTTAVFGPYPLSPSCWEEADRRPVNPHSSSSSSQSGKNSSSTPSFS